VVGVAVVPVPRLGLRDVIEYTSFDLDPAMFESLDGGMDFFQGVLLGLGDEEGGPGQAGHDDGVGDGQDGGGVDEDQVVEFRHGLDEGLQPLGHEELRGVGRQDAGGDEVQARDGGPVHHVLPGLLAREDR